VREGRGKGEGLLTRRLLESETPMNIPWPASSSSLFSTPVKSLLAAEGPDGFFAWPPGLPVVLRARGILPFWLSTCSV
jgi:hypothetical protein